ncbi:MAG: thiolase family protein [Proteobacteria bacterium]|nr:thiolase family protein [Pseudomonadota bacterium]
MHPLRGVAAIVGACDTEVGIVPDKGPTQLCAQAILGAVDDAGLSTSDIDGLITCNSMADPYMYHSEMMAEYLQIFPGYTLSLGAGGGASFAALHHAASAIATGMATTVVVALADCLRTGLTRDQAMAMQSSSGHPQFERPFGPTVPAFYGLVARAYMHAYGATSEHLAAVAVSAREHACRHPHAQMREPITIEDVMTSRMIADPLRLLDCSLVSDGGCAVVLTSAERARDLRQQPVYLLGAGEGHSYEHISAAHSLLTSAAAESGRRAYDMAGLTPSDIDVAGIYDCFTPVVLIELEDLGFCKKGEAGDFVADGGMTLGGALPTNTHGGLLSHSHAGNPGSMFALTECVHQLRHNADDRQVDNAQTGLVHAQGGILSSHCTVILGREND